MAYIALGNVPDSLWEKARSLGDAALAELEDAADGVFGANVNKEELERVQNAKIQLHQATQFKRLDLLRQVQEQVRASYEKLPTALYYRVNPFMQLVIPQEAAKSPAAASGSSSSGKASGSPSSAKESGIPPPSSGMGAAIGFALVGIAAAVLLFRKK